MANTESNIKNVALKRATTWGTAVNATKKLDGDFAWTASQGQSMGSNVNWKHLSHIYRTDFSVGANVSGLATYDGAWIDLLYGIMRHDPAGSPTAPTLVTVGQGDYRHSMGLGNPTLVPFFTIAEVIDSANSLELPSVQVQSMTLSQTVNQTLNYSFECVADRYVRNGENTYAELQALSTSQAYEEIILGGTNAYFRLGDTADALTSGDNKEIISYSLTLNRSETAQRAARGANSPYILQPRETGRVTGQLSVTFADESQTLDFLTTYLNSTAQSSQNFMAELFMDGTQIASGSNRSLKIQFPFLCYSSPRPTGFNRNEDNVENVTVVFEIMSSASLAATPTGMTNGQMTVDIVNTQATGYAT